MLNGVCTRMSVGRMYDFHVLDMVELGIENFTSLSNFKVKFITKGVT